MDSKVAVLGSSALLEVEINAALEVFKLLEPEVQRGFIALFHLFHNKQHPPNNKQQLPNAASENLSSTSLDPDIPSTG